jgi:ubiquinone/menaquinone biosynthesis C-methylase UbiE
MEVTSTRTIRSQTTKPGHHHVCPWWLGYALLLPVRRFLENPERILGPHVHPGARILEVGCGMGFFTLPLARLAGDAGSVVCLDVQPRMLAALERRARRAGLQQRIEARLCGPEALGLAKEAGTIDLAVLIHVLHELPDARAALAEIRTALAPEGRVLLIEPPGHVSAVEFERQIETASAVGLVEERRLSRRPHGVLLQRSV